MTEAAGADAWVREVQHPDPVWRDETDFIIGVAIDGLDSDFRSEQIWARRLESDLIFQVCCIPFFEYDLSLGDHVRTSSKFGIVEVVAPSEYWTFRVAFEPDQRAASHSMADECVQLGALVEWYSPLMFPAAIDGQDAAQKLADHLHQAGRLGLLHYETAASSSRSRRVSGPDRSNQ